MTQPVRTTASERHPPPGERRRSRGALVRWLNMPGLAVLVGLVMIWQVLASLGLVSSGYVPSPLATMEGVEALARLGELLPNVVHTVSVVVVALLIAALAGIAVGVLIGLFDPVWTWTGGTIDVLRSLPVVALVPLALVVFGLSPTTEVVVAAFAATWPILLNAAGAVHQIHPRLHDVARTLRLSRWSVVAKVILPAAAPTIAVGLRIGMTVSLIVTVTAEMVAVPHGIGYGLVLAQNAVRPDRMYAYVAVVLAIGLLLNAAVMALSRMIAGER